jgi:hypothetical protein
MEGNGRENVASFNHMKYNNISEPNIRNEVDSCLERYLFMACNMLQVIF